MAQKPLDPRVKRRVAELIGLGLTHKEAAGATGVSPKSVERTLADPVYRKIADDAKQRQVSVAGSMASLIRELLEATNQDGTLNLPLRDKGAELAYKHPDWLEAAEEESGKDLLPDDVIILFPLPDDVELEEPGPVEEPAGTGAD